jgi:hypothetical protein
VSRHQSEWRQRLAALTLLRACSSLTITLLVQLNSDPTIANGRIALWADDKLVVNEEGLLLRSGTVPTTRTGKGGGSSDTAAGAVTPSGSAQWVDKVRVSSSSSRRLNEADVLPTLVARSSL